MTQSYFFKSTVNILLLIAVILGVLLRLYRITANDFLFYDEGMYVGQNHDFLKLVAANPPKNIHELLVILGVMVQTALNSPKSLWFFLLDLRVFLVGPDSWYFSRVLSAMAGLAAIPLTYFWASRYYKSPRVGLLSAAILCLLPSHMFYSRLGMQESLSAVLFLAAMYLYVFSPRGFNWRSAASALLLGAVFFTNYRMIIAPFFPLIASLVHSRVNRQPFDTAKFIWVTLCFLGLIFGLGALYDGANTFVTFAWIFYQADESGAYRHWTNFFSFPYYIFVLEGVLFGILFLANFFNFRQRWWASVPFLLVLGQMILFSFAAEKGARYLCVVLPFAAMAVGSTLVQLNERFPRHQVFHHVLLAVLMSGLMYQSFQIVRAQTDYAKAVALVLAHDPQAKIMSTQPTVESLFVPDERNMLQCPMDPAVFAARVSQGFRYLIVDPQAYVSWTADRRRFTSPLVGHLEFIRHRLAPVAELPHIDGVLLRRFVLDHNQDLRTSLKFLKESKGKGHISIYDLLQ